MWQRAKDKYNSQSTVWYDNSPLGKNTLGQMMQNISGTAGLSFMYTNHCIRATCITLLDNSGCEARHIMGVSGHKSESSIKHYASRLSEQKKRDISSTISCKLLPKNSNDSNMNSNDSSMNQISGGTGNIADVDFLDILDDSDLANALKSIENVSEQKCQKPSFNFQNCSVNINYY